MIIPTKYNQIDSDKYNEDIIFSLHRYIVSGIIDLSLLNLKIEQNKDSLNEHDLYGKYNGLNFTLDHFLFHMQNNFLNYPKNRNFKLDFLYTCYCLVNAGADIHSPDWKRETFMENINKVLEINNARYKHLFIDNDIVSFLNMNTMRERQDFLFPVLQSERRNSVYSYLYLTESNKNNSLIEKKIKI